MNEQIQQVIEKISQAVQESPETVEAAIQNGGEEGFKQVITSLQKGDVKSAKAMIQKLATRKAAHGAKLNYFRKLKNQCPEGEELYYYKKGGKAGCGCRKKENSGEIVTAKEGSAVEKFKKGQFGLRTNELVKNHQDKKKEEEKKKKANTWGASTKYIAKPKNVDPKKMPQDNTVPNEDIPSHDKKANRKKCGGKVEKDCNGAVAKFKAKCGSKLKKHQQGGSLNSIPFMQAGTPKGGIEYNPTEVYNPMVHGVIGPTSYDPMIHGVVGPKETPQQKVEQYKVAQYRRKYPKTTEQTNGQKVIQRGKELLGNVTALTRVPVNAVKNWWNSTPSKNLNQIAYANRNTNSWDLGQRYLGLKNGGIL